MIPRKELLKVALAHARAGAKFLRDDRGIPVFRLGRLKTDMIGRFIPVSSYYALEGIESMITYEIRDAGVFDDEELRFINEMNSVNILDDDQWVEALERKLDVELETGDE